jgi:hypothetical protein
MENDDDNTNDDGIQGGHELPKGGHEEEMNERYGARTVRYDLRPRKPRDYSHVFASDGGRQMGEDEEDDLRTDDDDEEYQDNRVHTTALPKTSGM